MINMEYCIYKLSEISKLYAGGDAPKEVSNIRTDEFCYPIYSNGLENEGLYGYSKKATMKANTITVSARGTIGAAFYRKESFLPIVRLITIEPNDKKVDSWYLYYYLQLNRLEGYGTSQQQLTLPFMKKRKVLLYKDLFYQKKIATILNNYDQLIENNNKRIKLLESMAEELYKEWFIRFRFPGHEMVKFENGLPNGWEIKRIMDFGNVRTGKTPSTEVSDYYGEDYLFVKTPDMHSNIVVINSGEKLSELGNKSQKNCLLPPYSIMVSCIGTGGVTAINYYPAHTNQQINSIILKNKNQLEWLYFQVKSMKETIIMFGNTGSTMTNLSKGKFQKLKLLKPTDDLIVKFSAFIRPLIEQEINYLKQNELLAKQRDALLPRLMSGKLSVEGKEVI